MLPTIYVNNGGWYAFTAENSLYFFFFLWTMILSKESENVSHVSISRSDYLISAAKAVRLFWACSVRSGNRAPPPPTTAALSSVFEAKHVDLAAATWFWQKHLVHLFIYAPVKEQNITWTRFKQNLRARQKQMMTFKKKKESECSPCLNLPPLSLPLLLKQPRTVCPGGSGVSSGRNPAPPADPRAAGCRASSPAGRSRRRPGLLPDGRHLPVFPRHAEHSSLCGEFIFKPLARFSCRNNWAHLQKQNVSV